MSSYLDLYDYRRYVFNMYHEKRQALLAGIDPEVVLQRYREARDWLFAHHPQTALTQEQIRTFTGLNYFPYNPSLRFVVDVDVNVEPVCHEAVMDAQQKMTMVAAGRVNFVVDGQQATLTIYWLDIYGGGLFLPFRDATNGHETYGGGRYLFDTIKGSDFLTVHSDNGSERIVLDFNYAYNPSCAYNDRSVCPLSPPENKLAIPINAGEKKYLEDIVLH
ncbi:MAG TPA: DUF1684 domain-containing protein [Ktedonobacteraceae bacterium]|nr:DUF1684 domain-containing protein [Ktedonobacteraceae bacterium]